MPYEKLVKLLTLLQYSIKDGCKVIPLDNVSDFDTHSFLPIYFIVLLMNPCNLPLRVTEPKRFYNLINSKTVDSFRWIP